ncbi:MAG: biotin synthase BioB [Syntrophobacterales bacterium]|jgi:biotin synthase|nr:biotin synthase BioB [Syntrophobacterales bacterium]
MLNATLIALTEKIIHHGYSPSGEEMCAIARLPEKDLGDLIFCAHKITQAHRGNVITVCAILNAKSGFCTEDCAFCAQSSHHKTDILTYDLKSAEDMAADALERRKAGATRFSMVASGLSLTDDEMNTISRAAKIIRRESDIAVCASVGTLTSSRAHLLKESGVTTYHHNLETARSFFREICTTHDYDDDINTLRQVKEAGLRVCSGGILGLGESWEQRIELACTLRDLDVDGIPLNFINPVAGTRMENQPLLAPLDALKCIALFRFINPGKEILICGGRELTLGDLQSWIFMAGASGFMAGNYLTTAGRNIQDDWNMIRALGLQPAV